MLGYTPLAKSALARPQPGYTLFPISINAGSVLIDDLQGSVISNFSIADVAFGSPSIDTAIVAVTSNFYPLDLQPLPVSDALPFFQKYALTVLEITAGTPTLPARFLWDFQELSVDNWTEQSDDGSVWSIQTSSSDIWSAAA